VCGTIPARKLNLAEGGKRGGAKGGQFLDQRENFNGGSSECNCSQTGRAARVTSSGTANDLYSELRSDAVVRVTRMIASAAQVERYASVVYLFDPANELTAAGSLATGEPAADRDEEGERPRVDPAKLTPAPRGGERAGTGRSLRAGARESIGNVRERRAKNASSSSSAGGFHLSALSRPMGYIPRNHDRCQRRT